MRLAELDRGTVPLPEMFAAQAAKTPDATAVRDGERRLDYAELDRRSALLARTLNEEGVGRGQLVAVVLDRSAELLVTLLGVLRSGAAYVPINPDDPAARTEFVIRDAGPSLILMSASHAGGPSMPSSIPVRLVDGDPCEEDGDAAAFLHPRVTPSDAAYVIYTSGSTGRPKGVVVEHGALGRYLDHVAAAYPSVAGRTLLHSSASFDMAVTSLFGPLVTGGAVELADLRTLDAGGGRTSVSGPPSFLKVTPSHLPLLVALPEWCSPTGHLVVGGEGLTAAQLEPWRARHPSVVVVNEYGPTEAAVGCCVHELPPGDGVQPKTLRVPIGRPTAGTTLFVLDERMRPVPPGTPGELHIAGRQLARGYLGRPGATASRFVADPFGRPGERMYRSGDIVRALPDGRLEFLGRADDQIKLDGHRIEPGEIETVLAEHDQVAQAVVTLRGGAAGARRLTAYVVPAGDGRPDPDDLRRHTAARLPAHMVPADFEPLAELPLTAGGKIDHDALPEPRPRPLSETPAVPSQTVGEALLCRLFADLTGAAAVGVDDDFFQLGGTSIGAAKLVTRARREGVALTVEQVLEGRTVRRMLARPGRDRQE